MIEMTSEPDTAAIFEADTIGLTAISARLEALEDEHGNACPHANALRRFNP